MRRAKFWIITIVAVLTLVSLRDKEVVLNMPTSKPLVAEAYQPPSDSQSPGRSIGNNSVSGAPSQSSGSSDYYYSDSTNPGGIIPSGLPNSSGASQPDASAQPSVPGPKTPAPAADPQVVYYGLGGVFDTTSDINNTQNLADGGGGTSDGTQKLLSPNPVYITGLLPGSAKGAVEVVIQGAGFSSAASGNTVKFGSAQSTSVRAVSVNQLRAAVPQDLASGFTDVTVSAESDSKPALFDVLKDTAAAVFIDNTNTILPTGLNLQDSSIIRFVDIDGDKDLDMLILDKVSGKLYLLANNGSGHFTDVTSRLPSAIANNASYITDVAFGDVDNDGTQDILLSYSQGQSVKLLANSASGTFTDVTAAKIPALSGNAVAIDLGDVNGDGYPDIVVANSDSKDTLLVNDGTGKFDKDTGFVLPATIDGSSDIRFCDIDSDGDLDIITTNRDVVDSSILQNRIYLNNGSGVFTDATDMAMPPDIEYSEVLDTGDLNRDGYIDLIVGCYGQNLLLLNNGGVFKDKTAELMPTNYFHARDIKLGDMNGDGYLDLIVLGEEKVSLFMNNGTGSFKEIDASIKLPDYKSVPALVGGRNVQLVDVDGDGALDIVIGGSSLHILISSAVNKAPVLDPIGSRQVEAGKALTFNINATDPNGDALIYSAQNLPSGATFQAANKLFSWTPGSNAVGEYSNVIFKATEDRADPMEDSEAIAITVTSGDLPVIDYYIPVDPDINAAVGDIIQFGLKAHDPKGGALTFKWLFNGNEIPSIGYSDSSVIFIIPKIGKNTIEVQVKNATGMVSVKWNLSAGENLPPVIDTYNPVDHQDIDLTQGAAINFNITAHDPEGDLLSYAWKLDDIALNGGTNGALDVSSFIANLKTGTHELTVEVNDGYNQPVIHQWVLDVTQSPTNSAPAIVSHTPPENIINIDLTQGAALAFGITATDPDGDILTYIWRLDGIALSSTTKDLSSGAYASQLKEGDLPLSVSVNDGHYHTVTQIWTLHVTQGQGPVYTLVLNATNGSVSKNPDNATYTSGASVQLTATPGAGYTFTSWSGDITGTTSPANITMDANKTVTANFSAIPPSTITASVGTGGSISPSGQVSVPYGTNQLFTVTADSGYTIDQALVDGSPVTLSNGTYTFNNVKANHTISVSFAVIPPNTYTLVLNATNGSVSKNPDNATYTSGASVQLTATPSAGYTFTSWSGDISGSTNPTTITMNANKTVTANFTAIPPLTITASAGAGGSINPSGSVSTAYGASQTFTVTPDSGYLIDQVLIDGAAVTLTAGTYTFTNVKANHAISASFSKNISTSDQIIQKSFLYFWNETDNPATGFTRDRLAINPDNRNMTYDERYNAASMAATGFGLSAMCVAAEKYGDGSNPDWKISKDLIRARVRLIFDKLLDIQSKQDPANPDTLVKWGRDGFFHHFVNIETGERWDGSEVSTIDTALLVAGVLTAGEYFGGDLKDDALKIYSNVNWKAFLDTNQTVKYTYYAANPFYNQMYHGWDPSLPDGNRFIGHWDYASECPLLYILAVASPNSNYAIPPESFYAFRRELGNSRTGNPMVKSWFGSLFTYQYAQAFFNFKDSAGHSLFDKSGVDWWQNSVEAAKANKLFCNDNLSNYAGEEDLWGLTSGYTDGFPYNVYGAPPAGVAIPSTDVHGADGTVFPSAAGGSIAFLPDECERAINKMKELYDTYGYKIWGDYGFVDSFKMGDNLNISPSPIASFYCAIDNGAMLVAAENRDNGLIWNNFAGFDLGSGKTLKSAVIEKIGFTTDPTCVITVDDQNPDSGFHMGRIDPANPTYTIKFDLTSVETRPYILAIHSYMDQGMGSHTVTANMSVNRGSPMPVTFEYDSAKGQFNLMKYIQLNPLILNTGTNTITLEWQDATNSARWLAWKNIEVASPVSNDTLSIVRGNSADPAAQFGNEYRVDDTYYAGANINTFEQALNKDSENFTDILFYTENTEYATLTLMALETHSQFASNVQVFVNGAASPAYDGQIAEGRQITTPGFYLQNGWNRITLYHPGPGNGAKSDWIKWNAVTLVEAVPPVLSAPKGFAGASFGKDKARLKWRPVNGAVKYNLYRADSQDGAYSLVGSANTPSVIYEDTGLNNSTPYYYVAKAVKSDDTESTTSSVIKVTTGAYQLDYGDGHDPNVFGGSTLDNGGALLGDNAFIDGTRYNGISGKVRKALLQPGWRNTVTLNNSNISDAKILSFRVKGDVGGEKFIVAPKDSSGKQTRLTFTVAAGGVWQEMHILLTDFPEALDLSSMAAIDIISAATQPITIYFDEVELGTVALETNSLNVKIRDRFTDELATGLSFGSNGSGTKYVSAGQYLDIDYQCSGNWNIIMYTDNKSADAYPKFTGTQEAGKELYNGLIGVQNSGYRAPMVWQVFQTKMYTTAGATPPWGDFYQTGYVVDKNDWDYWKDQYSLPYRTILKYDGDLGFPLNPSRVNYHLKGTVGQRLYVYLGANFEGVPGQTYTTSKFTIDIYNS